MLEMFAGATTREILLGSIAFFGVGFLGIYFVSMILEYFVGLRYPPKQRARLTVGLAYVVTTAILVIVAPIEYAIWTPLAAMPAAIGWYFHLKSHLSKAWFENADDIPEHMELAPDDWQSGLLKLAIAVVVLVGIFLFRLIRQGIFG